MNATDLPNVDIQELPVSILPLSRRALNTLYKSNITTIGELLELCVIGVDLLTGVGKKMQTEIETALNRFMVLYEGTTINLGDIPLDALTLSKKVKTVLDQHGVKTIGDLLQVRREGILKAPSLDKTTIRKIRSALEQFLHRFNLGAREYTEEIIDDRPFLLETNGKDIRRLILPLAQALFTQEKKGKYYEVLRLHFGVGTENAKTYTLDEIGKYLELTRERVRQIEASAINRLSEIVLGKEQPRHSRLPQVVPNEFTEVRSMLIRLGVVISDTRIQTELDRRYGTFPSFGRNELHLLMRVLGFRWLPLQLKALPGVWTTSNDVNPRLLKDSVRQVRQILRENVLPLPLLDLIVRVSQTMGKDAHRYVPYAIDIVPDVEEVEISQYQIRFDRLRSLADKAYRILNEAGEPFHYREITKRINHHLAQLSKGRRAKSSALISQLAADDRFYPIGRSGIWCLSHWKTLSKATIIELMKEFFYLYQKPATSEEVYKYVKSKRKYVSKSSIEIYLTGQHNTFVRVSKNMYELTEWGSKTYAPSKPSVDEQTLYKLALEKVVKSGTDGITLAELSRLLSSATGLTSGTIYRHLHKANWIILGEKKGKGRSRLIHRIIERPNFRKAKKQLTIRSHVQSSIVENLSRFPEKACRISELANLVMSETKCLKPTFYSYLNTTPGIIKYNRDGMRYCKLAEDKISASALYPSLETIQNKSVQRDVRRALKNLTVENVDVGLFLLGKILEQQLRSTLLDYREAGLAKFPSSAIQGLSSAINLAVHTGIIKEKHHLDFLRRERNERAHGSTPSLEKRLVLFKQAPYLAGLYIEYIALLESKQQTLKTDKAFGP